MESVVAMFKTPQEAGQALQVLLQRGFSREHLGFAMADPVAKGELAQATGISPEEGAPAGAGAVIKGALLGTAAGLLLTVPVWILLTLPGMALTPEYVRGGAIAALFGVLGGLPLGGLFGALSGSDHGDYVRLLRGFGVPARDAERMYEEMQGGQVMVIARGETDRHAQEASRLLRGIGAGNMQSANSRGGVGDVGLTSEGRGVDHIDGAYETAESHRR